MVGDFAMAKCDPPPALVEGDFIGSAEAGTLWGYFASVAGAARTLLLTENMILMLENGANTRGARLRRVLTGSAPHLREMGLGQEITWRCCCPTGSIGCPSIWLRTDRGSLLSGSTDMTRQPASLPSSAIPMPVWLFSTWTGAGGHLQRFVRTSRC